MPETTCPQCGKTAEGSFCSWCGAALGGRHCDQCGARLEPGARFCNRCGTPLAEGAGGDGGGASTGGSAGAGGVAGASGGSDASQLGWWVAGGALVALILVIAYPVLRQDAVAPPGTAAPAGSGPAAGSAPGQGASSVDLSSMTPREAADALFNRVMRAASAGDSAQVASFLPMSTQAYERARPLDPDGLFHLALLQQTGGDFEGALATAREALEENPNHLLNLGAAAQAAHAMGDDEGAREYYRTLLEGWDEELAAGRPEYDAETAHGGMLPGLRQEAEDFLNR